MKFITRRPLNWFGPYHLLYPLEKVMERVAKRYDLDDEFASDVVHFFAKDIPSKPFELLHKFRKNFPWNKDIVKIDPWDTWGMYGTLAHIIVPMLKQLKATKHGVPNEYAEVGGEDWQRQRSFDFYSEDRDKLFDEHGPARWNIVMDKMIWSFEQILIDQDPDAKAYWEPYWEDMTEEEVKQEKNNIFKQLDVDHPRKKINRKKLDEYNEKLDEGFKLFGKHYMNLWD